MLERNGEKIKQETFWKEMERKFNRKVPIKALKALRKLLKNKRLSRQNGSQKTSKFYVNN